MEEKVSGLKEFLVSDYMGLVCYANNSVMKKSGRPISYYK